MSVADAAATLRSGGVIAYPTEGIFGLGCLPGELQAIERILQIKQRDPAKGLILIAANAEDFDGWIQLPEAVSLPTPDLDKPTTWIVPAGSRVADLVRGDNEGVAVRITTHPIAKAICTSVRSPIISTSANLSGQKAAADQDSLRRDFGRLVDCIIPGDCGPFDGPSEIRTLIGDEVLRQNKSEQDS